MVQETHCQVGRRFTLQVHLAKEEYIRTPTLFYVYKSTGREPAATDATQKRLSFRHWI